MIEFITTTKMTDRSVVASCLLGSRRTRFDGIGLPSVVISGDERPTKAPATAVAADAAAQANAYAFATAVKGAEAGQQKTQLHMWAFRGLEPWRDPA